MSENDMSDYMVLVDQDLLDEILETLTDVEIALFEAGDKERKSALFRKVATVRGKIKEMNG